MTQDTPDPDRYLIEALAFEKELRARLYRCTRNNSDVDELLQEVYARLVKAGASTEAEVRSAARHLANQMFARMPGPDPTDGPPDAAPVKEKPP